MAIHHYLKVSQAYHKARLERRAISDIFSGLRVDADDDSISWNAPSIDDVHPVILKSSGNFACLRIDYPQFIDVYGRWNRQ
jgi:hypothetical protein